MGILDAVKNTVGDAVHGAEDAAKGAGRAVEKFGEGTESAVKDVWHGTVEGMKTAGSGLAHAGSEVAHGAEQAAHDVADGARHGDVLGGLARAQQHVAAGSGAALSDTWHAATGAVGKMAGGTMNAVRDEGKAASKAYDAGVDGVSRAVTDVAGKKAGAAVRTVAEAAAEPVRQQAKFAFGVAEGLGDGLGQAVRGTGDMVVGAVRVGTDSQYRDKLIAKVGQTATALGRLGERAWHDPTGTARAVGHAAEGAVEHIVQDGKAAAARGDFAEWAGKGVGEAGAQVAMMVAAPEAEGANAARLAGEGAEAVGGMGRLAGAVEKIKGAFGRVPATTREKIDFALVDSGSGGAMTAAKLDGEVRQLGYQFCLPLGAKSAEQAIPYTASMILDPMIHPLAGAGGKFDGRVAEHVIIACNTASVRTEKAFPLIRSYVEDVAKDVNKTKYALSDEERTNIGALAKEMEKNPRYLEDHVHDVVKPTAVKGADNAADALLGEGGIEKPDYFARVDSTAGTAKSGDYPQKMQAQLVARFDKAGYTLTDPPHSWPAQPIKIDGHEYQVSHTMLEFKKGDQTRRVFIENRGNPPWVDNIEDNTLHRKQGQSKVGDDLVKQSNQASRDALDRLENPAPSALGEKPVPRMPPEVRAGFEQAPDLEMLSCTHYPAMQDFLANPANGKPPAAYLNQADIVKDIVGGIRRDLHGTPAVAERELSAKPHLEIVQTIGSRANNGLQYLKTEGPLAKPSSRAARAELGKRESVIQRVVNQTRNTSGGIKDKATVRVVVPTEQREIEFERLHRHIAMQDGQGEKIMAGQGYRADAPPAPDGKVTVKSAEALEGTPTLRPDRGQAFHPGVERALAGEAGTRIDRLAGLVPTGEQRGMTVLATKVDTGQQLREAAGQLGSIVQRNAERHPGETKEGVAILTGFKVINNDTRKAINCENDGPPGAMAMAKMLLDQGTPVSLVTDKGSERVLKESLVSLGLAKPGRDMLGRPTYEILNKNLKVHVSDVSPRGQARDMPRIKDALIHDNTQALVTIERPGPNLPPNAETKPIMTNMAGQDISKHNADFSSLFAADPRWKPYTIGIGDGGNEMGMGNLHDAVANTRLPSLDLMANNGERIAASSNTKVNAIVVGSVSNNGGVALAMATRAALGQGGFANDVRTYDSVIDHLYKKGLSLDGVSKKNAMTVDGRALGTTADSALNPDRMPGDKGATHHDMFREMLKRMGQ